MKPPFVLPKFSDVRPAVREGSVDKKAFKASFAEAIAIIVHLGVPVICWCFPFAFAYFSDLPIWASAIIGYLGSSTLMTAYLLYFQSTMGRRSWKAPALGLSWPATTFTMVDPVGLSIDLGMA